MRKVGEGGFGALAQARKAPRELRKNDTRVACVNCGTEESVSYFQIKQYHQSHGFRCFECRIKESKADKRKVNEAIIALAKRKGLI